MPDCNFCSACYDLVSVQLRKSDAYMKPVINALVASFPFFSCIVALEHPEDAVVAGSCW